MRLALALTGNLSLGSGASAFTPASLFASGEEGGYYDPAEQSGVDSGVSSLTDLSGNGNHATQATGANQPVLRQDASGYNLEFNGTSRYLDWPTDLVTGWTAGTVVFAAILGSTGINSGSIIGDVGSSGDDGFYPHSSDIVYDEFLSTARHTCGDPGDVTAWHVGDFRSEANNFRAGFNGTDYYTTGTNTVGNGTVPKIGRSGAWYFGGSCGRIIIINRVLTAPELANARAWVGAGNGVVL